MNMHNNQNLYGIIGYPLIHSHSPYLFDWIFKDLDINSSYMAWEVLPENLSDFMDSVRNMYVQGLSVTIPYKEQILHMVDHLSDSVKEIGAANTIYWKDNLLCAENTDMLAFIAPLMLKHFDNALLLGSGGVARAVLVGLKRLKISQITICNHNIARAQQLAQEFNVAYIPWEDRNEHKADLIVNATPLGMYGRWQGQSPLLKSAFKGKGLAYDLVYNPLITPFLQDAIDSSWKIQDGLSMFISQANQQLKLWTKREFNQAEAKKLISQKLTSPPDNIIRT